MGTLFRLQPETSQVTESAGDLQPFGLPSWPCVPSVDWIAWRHDGVPEQPGDGEFDAVAVPPRRDSVGHPGHCGLLDYVLGVEAFYLQVSGGQLGRAGVSDGGFGPVAEDPGGRCCHAVEVVDVLLGEPPVGRVRVEITAGGPGALLAITSEGQDAGDLSG